MQNIKDRLMQFVKKEYGEGQTAFEDRCGLSRGQINKMSNGVNSVTLSKITEVCPQLNLRWLLLGDGLGGEMYNPPVASDVSDAIDYGSLPLIPIDAFAGPGMPVYEDISGIEYYTVNEFAGSDFLIRVKGDSMTPKYSGGDIVACKKVTDMLFFQWGKVYVIYTQSQGVMIKRIQQSAKEDCIKCVSDNEKYAPFDVPKSDIVSLALVNGSISLE